MKSTLIGLIAAVIAVQAAFAEKAKKAQPTGGAVQVAAVAAKPVAKTAPSGPPWAGYDVKVTASERQVIRVYVRDCIEASKERKPSSLPPGLAKRLRRTGELPAGWQEKCVRGEVLPVEVHKRCHPLPDGIIVQLLPPPPGTVLVAIDGKVLRLGYPTREILDVFDVRHEVALNRTPSGRAEPGAFHARFSNGPSR